MGKNFRGDGLTLGQNFKSDALTIEHETLGDEPPSSLGEGGGWYHINKIERDITPPLTI